MIKYCSQCGQQVSQGTIYCVGCGAILANPIPPQNPMPQPNPIYPPIGNVNVSAYNRREVSFEKQGIETVRVACKVLNIEVLSSESEKIKIAWDETSSWSLSADQRGDCLQLTEQNFLGFHNFGDYFTPQQRRNLRIELPKDYNGALILENETGIISIVDIVTEEKIELKTTVGHIRAKDLKTNAGFRAEAQAGGVNISNIKAAEYFNVTGSIGQIILDTVRSDKIDVGVSASGIVDCRNIYAETSIVINASTGGIKCGIDDEAENFTAHCYSPHGTCNLPNTSGNGPKVFHASTSLGSIDVRFKNAEQKNSN